MILVITAPHRQADRIFRQCARRASVWGSRHFSGQKETKQSSYIDQWFGLIVKPQSFYDEYANAPTNHRRYFYNIDLQGRLFLEETLPKNIATSIKDSKFLDFFFSRIRRLKSNEIEILSEMGVAKDYPFVSPCGKELNFIRPAATPIVFHSLIDDGTTLVYGGTMVQPFDSSHLAVSEKSGKLYHRLVAARPNALDKIKRKTAMHDNDITEYGLIRSSVAVLLSEKIVASSATDGLAFNTPSGQRPISSLPGNAEPGVWSLPYIEGGVDG